MGPIKFTIIKKLPKNKRFNYTPRYYKGKEDANSTQYTTRIDAYADTYNKNDFSGQWNENRINSRTRNNSGLNKTILIFIGIFIFIFLYVIDFDLSIFFSKS